MDIQSHLSGNVTVLDLAGRLEVSSAPELKTWLNNSLPPAPSRVVVNLKQITFIDSTGLSALVQGMKRCRERNGDLRLCNLQATVRIIFELTRLDKAFEVFSDEAEAVKSFG